MNRKSCFLGLTGTPKGLQKLIRTHGDTKGFTEVHLELTGANWHTKGLTEAQMDSHVVNRLRWGQRS